ncbi:hypothetical protein EHV15_01890 [Paenibacillus oralis]|uniref:Uncharacterized protein n=1 Tax=Paenibacillus oralis TaxID=2490856 RepID=A0A3P3TUP7_9BACL|nr:hypothetical protein EHV15_01890 [Paenibacillus oralis]
MLSDRKLRLKRYVSQTIFFAGFIQSQGDYSDNPSIYSLVFIVMEMKTCLKKRPVFKINMEVQA